MLSYRAHSEYTCRDSHLKDSRARDAAKLLLACLSVWIVPLVAVFYVTFFEEGLSEARWEQGGLLYRRSVVQDCQMIRRYANASIQEDCLHGRWR